MTCFNMKCRIGRILRMIPILTCWIPQCSILGVGVGGLLHLDIRNYRGVVWAIGEIHFVCHNTFKTLVHRTPKTLKTLKTPTETEYRPYPKYRIEIARKLDGSSGRFWRILAEFPSLSQKESEKKKIFRHIHISFTRYTIYTINQQIH